MFLDTGSLTTCLYITVLVLMLVVMMPAIDTLICRKLGLNLMGGVSENPKAVPLMKIRSILIALVFLVYLIGMSYVVFFSRHASADYKIHIALFKNLIKSVRIDFGFFSILYALLVGNVDAVIQHIEIVKAGGITEFYLNVMMFIPMGYLLPYLLKWFRKHIRRRTLMVSFLTSLAIENIQLITKHGFYDIDDLFTNTLGGFLGCLLFIEFAFRVTHPNWKSERERFRRWKKNAKERTLYPFSRKVNLSRTFLQATDEAQIWDFYVMKLGFRVIKQLIPENEPGTSFLLELGSSQVEIKCSNKAENLPRQYLFISVNKIHRVKKRLEDNGITVSPYEQDPYTNMKCFSFEAPDHVKVIILSK